MPLTDADIIASLPELEWNGLAAPPYDIVGVEWDNGLAARRVPYVDGDVHDPVGRGSFPMTARLYFVNTLNAAPPAGFDRYCPDYWNAWQPQLIKGDAGNLVHPVLGPIRARVKGGKFEVRASVRSGIIVDVTWLETVEDPASLNLNGFLNTTLPSAALAQAVDDAVEPFGVVFAAGRPLTVLSSQYGIVFDVGATFATLAAIFDAIRGILFTGGQPAFQILTTLEADVAVMYDALVAQNSVFTYAACDALIAFYLACENMRTRLSASARKTAVYFPTTRTTLDAVARATKNSVKDIMGLNLALLVRPLIDRGTPVTYYKAA